MSRVLRTEQGGNNQKYDREWIINLSCIDCAVSDYRCSSMVSSDTMDFFRLCFSISIENKIFISPADG